MITDETMTVRFEIMLYSNDGDLGTLVRFDFQRTLSGTLRGVQSLLIFQPKNNGYIRELTVIRITIEIIFFVGMILDLWGLINTYRVKCR